MNYPDPLPSGRSLAPADSLARASHLDSRAAHVPQFSRGARLTQLLACIALLAGCATGPVDGVSPPVLSEVTNDIQFADKTRDHIETLPLSDTYVHNVFSRARRLVEHYTDTQLQHVELQLVDNASIRREVRRETRRLVESQFIDKQYADQFLNRLVNDQAGSYAALYTDQNAQVLVSRPLLATYLRLTEPQSASAEQAIAALLIHELVHAADDSKYEIHKNRVMSFKVSFTQSAAFEGHAQLVTRQICTAHRCLAGMHALEAFMFAPSTSTDPVVQSVQAISRNVLEYSYIEGERFLTALLERADGPELIDQVLRNPPLDPIQVLVPETYPDLARQSRNERLRLAIAGSSHPWSQYPWKIVETSPIKGINVREHPERRSAAIEGFTRLITAMESAQIYDQANTSQTPIDLTLLQAESNDTASMFAKSFLRHAVTGSESEPSIEPQLHNLTVEDLASHGGKQHGQIYFFGRDQQKGLSADHSETVLIALAGRYVLQLSGSSDQPDDAWLEFANRVISAIHGRKGVLIN